LLISVLPPDSAPLAAERKTCRSQNSRGGFSLNGLELQKIDACLVVRENVLKSLAMPSPITKST